MNWYEYDMNMILFDYDNTISMHINSIIELDRTWYSLLYLRLEQVLDLSQGWSQLVKVFHQFGLKLQPGLYGTQCISEYLPHLPHLVNEFSLSWHCGQLRADQTKKFAKTFKTLPSHSKVCLSWKQHLTKLLQIASAFPRRIWCFQLEPQRFSVSSLKDSEGFQWLPWLL